jgi:uncharacterized coiled-coil protein SlyX
MSGESEGLTARIRKMHRARPTPDAPTQGAGESESGSDRINALERRIAHLEQLVQGLQDSVHRETERHEHRLAELEARVDPAALAAALSKDARQRGL